MTNVTITVNENMEMDGATWDGILRGMAHIRQALEAAPNSSIPILSDEDQALVRPAADFLFTHFGNSL